MIYPRPGEVASTGDSIRCWRRICAVAAPLVLAISFVPAHLVCAQERAREEDDLTAKQQELLTERDRLWKDVHDLRSEGRLAVAIVAAEKMVAVERELFGEVHSEVASSLHVLGVMNTKREAFAEAEKALAEALAIKTRLYGQQHWQVTDARLALADARWLAKATAEERNRGAQAKQLQAEARQRFRDGDVQRAVELELDVLKILEDILGEEHSDVAITHENIAFMLFEAEVLDKAEQHYRAAIAIQKKCLGIGHPQYTKTRDSLVKVLRRRSDASLENREFAEASRALNEALAIQAARYEADDWRVREIRVDLKHAERLAALTPKQHVELERARKLNRESVELFAAGNAKQASQCMDQALKVYRSLLGADDPETLATLQNRVIVATDLGDEKGVEKWLRENVELRNANYGPAHPESREAQEGLALFLAHLANWHEQQEEFDAAISNHREVQHLRTALFGLNHWQVTDARVARERVELLSELSALQRAELAVARKLALTATELYRAGKPAKALPLAEQVTQIRRKLLGEKHPIYADGLNDLAAFHQSVGDYARAEPLHRQALEITKKTVGEKHPDYATGLNNLAALYQSLGDYAKAAPLFRQAMEIKKETLGEKHPDHAMILGNLAWAYKSLGDYAKAEPLHRQVMDIMKETLGEKHPDYATSLNNMAIVHQSLGDYAKAEPLYQQTLDITKETLGEKHPNYAFSLNNLAGLYESLGDYAKAEPMYRQALDITKETLGEKHPNYANGLKNLAGVYKSLDDYAEAEPLFRQALEITKETLGEKHPHYATNLNALATLYQSQGDYSEAEPLYRQSLEIMKATLGEEHPNYITSLGNLAVVYGFLGDYEKAESLHRQTLETTRRNLELCSAVQSERQQLGMSMSHRVHLDAYLTLLLKVDGPADALYSHIWTWKGAVHARQRLARLARQTDNPELAQTLEELQSISSRLGTLAFATPDPKQQDTWKRQIRGLSEQKERLEVKLSRQSVEFRQQRVRQQSTPAELHDVLAADVALVDFLVFHHIRPPDDWEWHLAAFVVRRDASLVLLDLGAIEPIDQAADAWRASIVQGGGRHSRTVHRIGVTGDAADPAELPQQTLRRLIWEPLEEHLDGVRTVLISPDGALGRVPLGALPANEPGKYLLEERSIVLIPVPQILPELLQPRGEQDAADETGDSDRLLLVGDVNFSDTPAAASEVEGSATVSHSAPRPEKRMEFRPLPGTTREIEAVQDLLTTSVQGVLAEMIRGTKASEAAFRQWAPSSRYLHLATHGFFAHEGLRSAMDHSGNRLQQHLGREVDRVTGFHPGLLSGLAMAGANQDSGESAELNAIPDDGILTALEVAELDLRKTDLAVLSACETGLGRMAGGEGLLGLQRAFQVAGAKTVVASLWKVDDAATQALMVEFYKNLWEKKLGKLEALRQAQLVMLNNYDPQEGELRSVFRRDKPRPTAEESDRVPPRYWAAFVLSGDWR